MDSESVVSIAISTNGENIIAKGPFCLPFDAWTHLCPATGGGNEENLQRFSFSMEMSLLKTQRFKKDLLLIN